MASQDQRPTGPECRGLLFRPGALLALLRVRYGVAATKKRTADERELEAEIAAAERDGLADGDHVSESGRAGMHKVRAPPVKPTQIQGE